MALAETVNITLYQNLSDEAVCGKNLTNGLLVKGTFREGVDLISPKVLLQRDTSGTTILEFNKFNYCKIAELNRCYFVTNMSIEQRGIIQLSLEEDFLETYSASIRGMTALVERCEAVSGQDEWFINKRIPDPLEIIRPEINTAQYTFSAKSENTYRYKEIKDALEENEADNLHLRYIIRFAVGQAYKVVSGADQLMPSPIPQLTILCTRAWLRDFFISYNNVLRSLTGSFGDVKDQVIGISVIPEDIWASDDDVKAKYKCKKYDATVTESTTKVVGKVRLGSSWVTDIHVNPADDGSTNIKLGFILDPTDYEIETEFELSLPSQISDLDYHNSSQYRAYNLRMYPFGLVDLPGDTINGTNKISVKVQHSLLSNQAMLYYKTSTNTYYPVGQQTLDFQIPFYDKGDFSKIVTNGIRLAATSALALGGKGENSGIEEVFKSAAAFMDAMPKREMHGELKAAIMDEKPILYIQTRQHAELPSHLYGKMSMNTVQLSLLPLANGRFIKLSKIDYSGFRTGTDPHPMAEEVTALDDILTEGFYLRTI